MLQQLLTRWEQISTNPVMNMAAACDIRTKAVGFLTAADRAAALDSFRAEVISTAEAGAIAAAAQAQAAAAAATQAQAAAAAALVAAQAQAAAVPLVVAAGRGALPAAKPHWKAPAAPAPVGAPVAAADPLLALRARVSAEVDEYLAVPQADDISDDPLCWWREQDKVFPNVAKVAKKYLNLPASSAPAERVFSTGKLVLTRSRWAMHPATLIQQVLLRQNRHIFSQPWFVNA
jgi:hypothetical protein